MDNAVIVGDMIELSPSTTVKFTATEDCYLFINSTLIELGTPAGWFKFPTNTNVQVKEGASVNVRSLDSINTFMINIIDQTYNPAPVGSGAGGGGIFGKTSGNGYAILDYGYSEKETTGDMSIDMSYIDKDRFPMSNGDHSIMICTMSGRGSGVERYNGDVFITQMDDDKFTFTQEFVTERTNSGSGSGSGSEGDMASVCTYYNETYKQGTRGENSITYGRNVICAESDTVVIGNENVSTGKSNTITGNGNFVLSGGNVVFGINNYVGSFTKRKGSSFNTAIGSVNMISSRSGNCTAVGTGNRIFIGSNLYAIGQGNTIGRRTYNSGSLSETSTNSMLIGFNNESSTPDGTNLILGFGQNLACNVTDCLVVGKWNRIRGHENVNYMDKPGFIVGIGSSDRNRADGMYLLNNGSLSLMNSKTSDVMAITNDHGDRCGVLTYGQIMEYLKDGQFGNSLPTSDPSIDGVLWNNNGALYISEGNDSGSGSGGG